MPGAYDGAANRLASITIHFDSLHEAYGFPEGFRDPCFSLVADRFFQIADRHGFKYTVFVIGRDLENPAYREAVGEWSRRGHEIANHSYSHHMDLGALPLGELYEEVARSHGLIGDATGQPPTGFASPAWSSSPRLLEVLSTLGYSYDTSSFPSWLLLPMALRIACGYRGSPKARRILRRKDSLNSLFGPVEPFVYRSGFASPGNPDLCVIPHPVSRHRVACWHTTGFMFGWRVHEALLRSCLKHRDYFYYVTHPADLLADSDLSPEYSHGLARTGAPLESKLEKLERMVHVIRSSGRRLVRMVELAAHSAASLAGGRAKNGVQVGSRRVAAL